MQELNRTVASISWTEDGTDSHYAVEVPLTSAPNSPFFFGQKRVSTFGQFAQVTQVSESTYDVVRDPLGIGKIFYTQDSAQKLHFSENFVELLPYGQPIYSSPRGKHVRIGNSGLREVIADTTPQPSLLHGIYNNTPSEELNFEQSNIASPFQDKLKMRLLKAFDLIKQLEADGYQIFIALSGGLDSSIIANLAKTQLKNPIACTLDLGASEDAAQGTKIAKLLGIKHLLFPTNEKEILEAVEESPSLCQDYRDFNVHCTALNILLAKNIKQWADTNNIDDTKRIVLTGDLMNEYTCDYAEEVVDTTIYYRLPRVGTKMLQRQLIGGLDTSDRERLPFKEFGLFCIQPYAITYDLYASLPENILQEDDIKNTLNSFLVPSGVIELQPKSKLRAQVGDRNSMGVLGLCHREGIDEHYFMRKLLKGDMDKKKQIPILMGRYSIETFK